MLPTNFSSFIAFFHPSHSEDLVQDLESVRSSELPLAVVGDLLQLICSDTESSKLADDMNQQRQAFYICQQSNVTQETFWRGTRTILSKMVRLLVNHIGGPPFWLCLLWVALLTRRGSCGGFTSIIGVLDLLSWLNELNECLCNLTAVKLLEVFQGSLIVVEDFRSITDLEPDHVH